MSSSTSRLLLFRSIRRYSSTPYPFHSPFPTNTINNPQNDTPTPNFIPQRSSGFSSAEEAAAERRKRKRRLRIEPPLYALRFNPQQQPTPNEIKPRLPDSTSALVGNRLQLHNRVQSLIRANDLDSASYIARHSVYHPVRPTVFTCNAIIAAMYRAKRYNDAKALFNYFFKQFNIVPNITSYNNLIVSHCELGEVDEAIKVYEYVIENESYSPSAFTYRHLTKGLVDAMRVKDAVSLLREMLNKGQGADSLVFNNVIVGFLRLGELDKANELFDELKERCTVYDGVVNATFMDWFFEKGESREAMESYRDLMGRGYRMVPATRNVLLETLLKHGKKKEAWDLFHDMLDDHTPPTFQAVNSDTVNMMVNECFKEGKIEKAKDVFKRSGKGVKSKPFQMDVPGFNNMITRFCELEMMEEAEQYYEQLVNKSLSTDVNTYRTLIDAYIKVDRVDEMIVKYSKMVELGSRVIPPYANKWFGYMIEKGKASECVPILSKMAEKEPKPDVMTYDVVIRGLVQESNYECTTDLVREMMKYGIGFTASLKEFILDAFEKLGRRMEIEDILNKPVYVSPPQRPPYQGVNSTMPWQRTSQTPNNANQFPQAHQSQMNSPSPHVAGQVSNQQGPWQRPSQTPNINQFSQQTHQSQMNSSPHMAGQVSNQQMQWQRTSQPTSYGNQSQEQTHQSQMNSSPHMAEQVRNQQNPLQRTSPPTSYGSQYQEQTQQSQMNPPYMSEQGRNQQMSWQTNYTPLTSYSNQFGEQRSQTHVGSTSEVGHGGGNPARPWQTSFPSQASYLNNFAEQFPRPPMTQHSHQLPEQEVEFPRVAGQNAR